MRAPTLEPAVLAKPCDEVVLRRPIQRNNVGVYHLLRKRRKAVHTCGRCCGKWRRRRDNGRRTHRCSRYDAAAAAHQRMLPGRKGDGRRCSEQRR